MNQAWRPHRRLLTIAEAAASIDRPTGTVYRWVHEGRLVPHAMQGRRKLYLESDVLRVDAETHRNR